MVKKMIQAMFIRIKKGPARDDMVIKSKKSNKEIIVFHWHRSNSYNINLIECDDNGACKHHELLAEDFKSWSEAFNWLTDYILEGNF